MKFKNRKSGVEAYMLKDVLGEKFVIGNKSISVDKYSLLCTLIKKVSTCMYIIN